MTINNAKCVKKKNGKINEVKYTFNELYPSSTHLK